MRSLAHSLGAVLASSVSCLPTHMWSGLFLIREAIFSHSICLFFFFFYPSIWNAHIFLWHLSKWLHLMRILQIHLCRGFLGGKNCSCNLGIQTPGGRRVSKPWGWFAPHSRPFPCGSPLQAGTPSATHPGSACSLCLGASREGGCAAPRSVQVTQQQRREVNTRLWADTRGWAFLWLLDIHSSALGSADRVEVFLSQK